MKTALTIAGSDSCGGAGIQADLKSMTMNGVYAMSAITALTAQNTTGVTAIQEATPAFLQAQLDAVFTDIFPDAVKVGMVSSTGLIHVKLRVRDLFSGIIMMTALYSVNLHIAGGRALVSIPRKAVTLFRNNPVADGLPAAASTLILAAAVVLIVKLLLDGFMKTRAGYLLRAVGDNETVVTALAKDKGTVKIVGLMIANALAALSGGVLCQQQRMFEISMGTGAMVLGLASVIIGMNLLGKLSFVKNTTAVIVGAVIYKMCVSLAIACGLGASDLKLITSALFLLILCTSLIQKKGAKKHA